MKSIKSKPVRRGSLASAKAPTLSEVKPLVFQPNPDLRRMLVTAGVAAQQELTREGRRMQSVDRVLRVIVR